MKKLLLISMLTGVLSLTLQAQDDDLYFVPKKKTAKTSEAVTDRYGLPKDTYYAGSTRSVDDYNRRTKSTYEVIDGDTTHTDVIEFSAVQGVFPDSLENEDFALTKQMSRFEGYDVSNNDAFWAGYNAGRYAWGWHSPWYFGRYGWYDPWYYSSWYGGWYDPWYYGSWYSGWYDPWYSGYYGWGYYGWGYPYHYYGYWHYPYYGGGYVGNYYGHTGNAGSIDRNGLTGYRRYNSVAGNARRTGTLRDRVGYSSGQYSSGNTQRSRSGNFSGRRSATSTYSNGNSSFGSSRSSGGSYSGGGGFSGGGHSSGGGARSGGGSLGGRR